ncbi:NAD-dependent epimerase/dehydratase family protein [Flagellimonas onchidii]|uniref:NAD-dependent epimerase/dehydratase family protein n=1 Tax=Flagellimonas onchidii TaxID=2562684 RepID=UPI0010A5F3BB|nr:NAD(P)-dependent oxidoreductase [Allomuricauda onchidii]
MKKVLVTGATGKVGQAFITKLLNNQEYKDFTVRALCHKRKLEPNQRIEIIHGSISDKKTVDNVVQDITHVLHLATTKESEDTFIDVSIKGMYHLLEACRKSHDFERFILIGGDASVGHYFYPHKKPVTETQKHTAYPGCYALSKVLEEVILDQYYVQYNFEGVCLRAPWIMEKNDLKRHLTFTENSFGSPIWHTLVGNDRAKKYVALKTIPLMLDAKGNFLKRNFVHLDDLVSAILVALTHPKAIQQTFNICMDNPVDYGEMANYLKTTKGLPSISVKTDYYSTWLDNSKAKFILGWSPEYDMKRLVDDAWDYDNASNSKSKT